jgi:hypothetical protein
LLEQLGPLLGQALFFLDTLSVLVRALPRLRDQLLLARLGEALVPPLRPVRFLRGLRLGLWLGSAIGTGKTVAGRWSDVDSGGRRSCRG